MRNATERDTCFYNDYFKSQNSLLVPEGVGLSRAATAAEVALNMSSVRMLDMTERSGSHLCFIQAIVYGIASPQWQKVTY